MFDTIINGCIANLPQYSTFKNQNCSEWKNKLLLLHNYIDLYVNRADYENLPEEFLEVTGKNRLWLFNLFFSPAIAFFKHEALGLQALPVCGMSAINIAGFPTEWTAYGANGTSYKLNEKNSVLMFNDRSYSIPFLKMMYNIDFMIEADTTHRQNLHAQRQPLLLEIEEDEKKSANEFINKLKTSDTIAVRKRYKDKNAKKAGEQPFDTKTFESGRGFEGDKLASDYRYFDNRNLSMLGYNNENMEKKERLVVDEINANNEVVDCFYTTALDCQKEAFDKINKLWGYNIKVVPKRMKTIKTEVNNGEQNTAVQQKTPVEELDK